MLDAFRSLGQSWLAKIVLMLIALSFVLWGVSGYLFSSGNSEHYVAKVDGSKISADVFSERLRQAQAQYAQIFGAAAAAKINQDIGFRKQVLEGMIDDLLISHEAKRLGLQVPDSALRDKILSMSVFASNGKFSRQRYQDLLAQNHLTPAQFESQLRQEMLMEQLESIPQLMASVGGQEATTVWQWTKEYRNVSILQLDSKQYLSQVHPTEQEIQNYFRTHRQQFRQGAQVQVQYVVFGPESFSTTDGTHGSAQEGAQRQFEEQLENFKNLLFSSDNLESVAKHYHLKVQNSPILQQGKAGEGVFADPKALALAFTPGVLAGKNSAALPLANGNLLAVHLLHYQAPVSQSLAEARSQVIEKLTAQKALALMRKSTQQLLQAAQSEHSLAPWEAAGVGSLQSYPELTRASHTDLPPALLNAIFLATPPALGNVTVGVVEDGSTSYLYGIKKVTLPNPALLNPAVAKEIQASLQEQRVRLLRSAYLSALREKARVRIQSQVLQEASASS